MSRLKYKISKILELQGDPQNDFSDENNNSHNRDETHSPPSNNDTINSKSNYNSSQDQIQPQALQNRPTVFTKSCKE